MVQLVNLGGLTSGVGKRSDDTVGGRLCRQMLPAPVWLGHIEYPGVVV